jgi:hypothetical protein
MLIQDTVDGEQKILQYVATDFYAYGQSTFNIPPGIFHPGIINHKGLVSHSDCDGSLIK